MLGGSKRDGPKVSSQYADSKGGQAHICAAAVSRQHAGHGPAGWGRPGSKFTCHYTVVWIDQLNVLHPAVAHAVHQLHAAPAALLGIRSEMGGAERHSSGSRRLAGLRAGPALPLLLSHPGRASHQVVRGAQLPSEALHPRFPWASPQQQQHAKQGTNGTKLTRWCPAYSSHLKLKVRSSTPTSSVVAARR